MVNPLLAGLVGATLALGILLLVGGARGVLPEFGKSSPSGADDAALRLLLAVVGFVGILFLTRWPVAALFVGAVGAFLPTLTVAKKRRRESIERVDAIATWVESLRDTMAASAGIHQALRASAAVAPAPIRTEVRDLVVRLQHESTSDALRRFAADVAHPLADMVVATLILATARSAGRLQDALAMASRTARDSASMMRHIESGRASVQAQSKLAGLVSAGIVAIIITTRRDFLTPFDSIAGQIAMFIICSMFFGSAFMLYRLSKPVDPRRIFQGIEDWSADHSPAAAPASQLSAEAIR